MNDLPIDRFQLAHTSCLDCEHLRQQGLKRCRKCGQTKEFADFRRRAARPDGLESACRACQQMKEASAATRERLRRGKYVARYGITYEQVQEMIRAQDGKCRICHEVLLRPHVDHCHDTGKVRGILCVKCNSVLGYARDRVEVLEEAIKYLRGYRE